MSFVELFMDPVSVMAAKSDDPDMVVIAIQDNPGHCYT